MGSATPDPQGHPKIVGRRNPPEMRVGYFISRFPEVSQTFILREIDLLRARGVQTPLFAIRRPVGRHILDDRFAEAATETDYILDDRFFRMLTVHVRAATSHPIAYFRTAVRTFRLARFSARSIAWQGFYFVEAILLAERARHAQVRHLQVHFATAGADVAMLATHFGRSAAGNWARSWSFTMHGPTEFADVTAFKLKAKVGDAAFVACISHFCISQLMSYTDPDDWYKLVLVRCSPPELGYAGRSSYARREAVPQLLAVGRLVPEKGFATLVRAVSRLLQEGVECHLTIVGDGPFRSTIEQEVRSHQLAGAVECIGSCSNAEVHALMADADLFCFPSFSEGLPIVLLEAILSQTPIVSTDVAGIPEILHDRTSALLVPPGDDESLAAAIGEALGDPDGARLRAAAAYSDYELRYSGSTNTDRLIAQFAGCGL